MRSSHRLDYDGEVLKISREWPAELAALKTIDRIEDMGRIRDDAKAVLNDALMPLNESFTMAP